MYKEDAEYSINNTIYNILYLHVSLILEGTEIRRVVLTCI